MAHIYCKNCSPQEGGYAKLLKDKKEDEYAIVAKGKVATQTLRCSGCYLVIYQGESIVYIQYCKNGEEENREDIKNIFGPNLESVEKLS